MYCMKYIGEYRKTIGEINVTKISLVFVIAIIIRDMSLDISTYM